MCEHNPFYVIKCEVIAKKVLPSRSYRHVHVYFCMPIDIRKGASHINLSSGLPMDVSHMSGGRFIIPTTHPRNKPVAEFVANNFALDRKIKEALGDVPKSTQWLLMELPRDEDKELIADFIINSSNESSDSMPMSPNTKTAYVSALVYLARHHNHEKPFKEMTAEDFFSKEIISIDEKTGKEKK